MEVLLKDAASKVPAGGETIVQEDDMAQDNQLDPQPVPSEDAAVSNSSYLVSNEGDVFTAPMSWNFDNTKPSNGQGMPFSLPDMSYKLRAENAGVTNWELLGMGLFEALPPTEMIEELSVHAFSLELGRVLLPRRSCGRAQEEVVLTLTSVTMTDIKRTSQDSTHSYRSYILPAIFKLSTLRLT